MKAALDSVAGAPDTESRIRSLARGWVDWEILGLQDKFDEFWPLRVVLGGNGKPCRLEVVKPTPGKPAAVVPALAAPEPATASNGPAPLTTGDIAHCFDGLRWDEKGWKGTLGEVQSRKWLQDCVAIPGQQGVSQARWNPVLIGAWLAHQGHVTTKNVRARFQRGPLMVSWLDAWKTYEADNFDTP